MGNAILDVILIGLVVAILPASIIITLLLLQGEGGVRRAAAFVFAGMAVRVAQGIIFGLILESSADKYGEAATQVLKYTLLLVLGILLLVAAFKKWRKEEDPDGEPPKWMTAVGGMSTAKAFGAGALLVLLNAKMWVFTLGAIGTIVEAQLDQAQGALIYLMYVLIAAVFLLLPLLAAAIAPGRSDRTLAAARGWLEAHNRTITVAASLIFGLLFLYRGLTSLLG